MNQNYFVASLVLLLSVNVLSAQNCTNTAANQTLDLRGAIYSQVSMVTESYKSGVASQAAGDVKYAEDICDLPYNSCSYRGDALNYTVYYPTGVNYKTCSLPAIFLFHGGGFKECTGSDADQINTLSLEFAKRGFIAFNVEYRKGVLLPLLEVNSFTAQQLLATYRAIQDGYGAIRSAIKRQREKNIYKEPYSIDTGKIFIGGMSAGSIIALHVSYLQQQSMYDKILPGMKTALGNASADYYLGESTINFKIKGLLNLWGGVIIPNKDSVKPANFFKPNAYMPPMIAFAGEQDSTINYLKQPLYLVSDSAKFLLTQTPIGYESRCTLNGTVYRLNSSYPKPDGVILGAKEMYNTLRSMKISSELYLDTKMPHGITDQDETKNKYFGLSTSSIDSTISYIAQRGATFFQAVMNGYAGKLNASVFEDCENYRFASTTKNNNTCKKGSSILSLTSAADKDVTAQAGLNLSKAPAVTVRPNPVQNVLYIQLSNASSLCFIDLIDVNGKILVHKQAGNATSLAIPVAGFAKGIYYVKVTGNTGISVSKWVKE